MDKNIRPKPGYIHPSLPLLPFQANILPLDASEDIEGEMEPSYEIREQDRLLPLANGMCPMSAELTIVYTISAILTVITCSCQGHE